MLTVIGKDGKYTGIQYTTDEERFHKHHEDLGETCIWIERKLTPIEKEEKKEEFDFDTDYGYPTEDDIKENENYKINKRLEEIDKECIRSLRSILFDGGSIDDLEKLGEFEIEARTKRSKISEPSTPGKE
jgi:hypothetical protein